MMPRLALASVVLAAWSCSEKPSVAYVPGPSFSQSVQITTAQGDQPRIAVGEALVLHASRRSGPWVAVAAQSLTAGACSVPSPPPATESEVAGNVRWMTDTTAAHFNVDYRDDLTRTVRFTRPGTFTLVARSHSLCGPQYESNVISVDVTAAR